MSHFCFPPLKSAEYADAGVPVVRISDVSEEGVNLANTVKIAAQPEFEKFRLQNVVHPSLFIFPS